MNEGNRSSNELSLPAILRKGQGDKPHRTTCICNYCLAANEIERLDVDAANERAEKESLAAIVRTRDKQIEGYRAAIDRAHARANRIAEERDAAEIKLGVAQEEIERLRNETVPGSAARLAAVESERDWLLRVLTEGGCPAPEYHGHLRQAMERDRQEIQRLRAALEEIRSYPSTTKHISDIHTWASMGEIAAKALSGEPSVPYQMTASEESSFTKAFARSPKRLPDETSGEPAPLAADEHGDRFQAGFDPAVGDEHGN